jgi:type I restriction-modification system DNA methylase subunit
MNPNVRVMLEEIYHSFRKKYPEGEISWDYFIDFLAADNFAPLIFDFNHKFEWLFRDKEIAQAILEFYDPLLLSSDYYDHLGDMYLEYFPQNSDKRILQTLSIPKNLEELLADKMLKHSGLALNVLDPKAGTGRLLMSVHKSLPNCCLFGVESDIRALRIALTNMLIHEIPAFLLNADILKHAVDLADSDGKYNWKFANHWYSCIDKLKPKASSQNTPPINAY